jgi:hypothetical protein
MADPDHEVTLAPIPLKVTVLDPWGDPKLLPLIVTGLPGAPDVTVKLAILGGGIMAGTTTVESDVEVPSTCSCPFSELVALVEVLIPTHSRNLSDVPR